LKSFETRTTWLIVIGLLIFAAVASALWPAIAGSLDLRPGGGGPGAGRQIETTLEGIPLPDALAGLPGVGAVTDDEGRISPWLVLAAISALVVGLIVGGGLVMGVLLRLIDRLARNVKADPTFNEQAAALAQREKERLQQLTQSQPPDPVPDHSRSRWSVVATTLVIVFLVFLTGLAVADTIYAGVDTGLSNPVLTVAAVAALVALLIVVAVVWRRGRTVESNENAAVSWGMIWVIVSGLIFLGIGIGLTLAMRTVEVP